MPNRDFHDPNLPLSVLFRQWPQTACRFLDRKMLCPSCPFAAFQTIADACRVYDLDEAAFRAELDPGGVSPARRSERQGGAGR